MNANNYYDILGVDTNASSEDIKRAYRKLSLIYHPDKHNNEPEKSSKFKILNEAYEILSNNITRDKYNRQNNINIDINNNENNKNYKTCNDNFNGEKNNISYDMLYPHNSYLGNINPYYVNKLENPHNSYDIMQNMCNMPNIHNIHNMHNLVNHHNNINIPKNIEITQEINYYQSYCGDNIPILINRNITLKNDNYCENETIYIDIESGTDNNEIITIKEKGNIINNYYGDVKIKIILEENSLYKRRGLDLIYTKNITFKESVCGFTFTLKHINGKTYTINNNTGVIINPNYTTCIPKLGFKKKDNIGNLIINYNIEYPDKLDKKVINIIKNVL